MNLTATRLISLERCHNFTRVQTWRTRPSWSIHAN